jgi:phosphatidylglycerol:prolipoprotein diacylglycerol transferase
MLVHPQFDPVAIHLGPLAIHWYGLMYLAGFVAFLWLGRKRITMLNDPQFSAKLLDDLLFFGVLGVILGGRLGYVLFYKAGYYSAHPLEPRYGKAACRSMADFSACLCDGLAGAQAELALAADH